MLDASTYIAGNFTLQQTCKTVSFTVTELKLLYCSHELCRFLLYLQL